MGKIVADPYKWFNFQAYLDLSSKSYQFVGVQVDAGLPTAAKLLFETELYESLLHAG